MLWMISSSTVEEEHSIKDINQMIEINDQDLEQVLGGFADTNVALNLQSIVTGPNVAVLNRGIVLQNSGANSQAGENSILDNNGTISKVGGFSI